MTAAKLRLAQAAMSKPETKIAPLCREFRVSRQTLIKEINKLNTVMREVVDAARDCLVIGSA